MSLALLDKPPKAIMVSIHDDCGAPIKDGYCTKCRFPPDMQSIAIMCTCSRCGAELFMGLCSDCHLMHDPSD